MTPTDNRPCTCHPDDAPPAPCARRYALAECRDIQANVMDRAQSWLNAADERGINITDENGYLAVIRDMMLEVVRLARTERLLQSCVRHETARAERAESERDEARDEVRDLTVELARARAERDALRADAKRYRWLRSSKSECNVEIPSIDGNGYILPGYAENLDAAIDVARAKVLE